MDTVLLHMDVTRGHQVIDGVQTSVQGDILKGASNAERCDLCCRRFGQVVFTESDRPFLWAIKPLMQLSSDVLPAPLGPIMAWMLCSNTAKLMSCNTRLLPKLREILLTSSKTEVMKRSER